MGQRTHQTKITVEWHEKDWLPCAPGGAADAVAWNAWAQQVAERLVQKLQQEAGTVHATDVHVSRAGEAVCLFVSNSKSFEGHYRPEMPDVVRMNC